MSDAGDFGVPTQATRPAARGFVHLASSRVVATALLFISFAITASALGPSGLGVYAFALATVALFQYVADFGFQTAVNREISQQPDKEPRLLPNLIYLRLGSGALTYGAMVGLLAVAGYAQNQREAATVAGLLLLTLALEPVRVPLEVRLRVAWPATVEAGEAVVFAAGTAALALLGAGPLTFVWLYVAANTLTEVLIAPASLRLTRLRWRPRPAVMLNIARISWSIGLVNLITTVYYGVDTLILAQFHSSASVGQYGAAYRVLTTIGVIPAIVMVLARPVLARSSAESRELLQRRSARIARVLLVLAIPVAIGGAMTVFRAFTQLPGFASYHSGGVALAILCPAAGFIFLAALAQAVLLVAHRERALVWISTSSLLLTLVACFALIPPYSLVGAAVATTITEGFVLLVSLVATRRLVGVSVVDASAGRLLGPAVLLAAALVPCYYLPPFAQIGVGVVVYLLALPACGAITWQDLEGFADPDGPLAVVVAEPAAGPRGVSLAEQLARTRRVRLVLLSVAASPGGLPDLEIRQSDGYRLGAVREVLSGAVACHIVGGSPDLQLRVAAAARMVGVPAVTAEGADRSAWQHRPLRRTLWHIVSDTRSGSS